MNPYWWTSGFSFEHLEVEFSFFSVLGHSMKMAASTPQAMG
jgi:hypothetical protein